MLERDEFVIDVARQQRVVDEGEKECEEIRREAEKTVHRLELLNLVPLNEHDALAQNVKRVT